MTLLLCFPILKIYPSSHYLTTEMDFTIFSIQYCKHITMASFDNHYFDILFDYNF